MSKQETKTEKRLTRIVARERAGAAHNASEAQRAFAEKQRAKCASLLLATSKQLGADRVQSATRAHTKCETISLYVESQAPNAVSVQECFDALGGAIAKSLIRRHFHSLVNVHATCDAGATGATITFKRARDSAEAKRLRDVRSEAQQAQDA